MTIIIKGAKEFAAALKHIQTEIKEKAIPQALEEAGNMLVEKAQSKAPVDTGTLRDSIQITERAEDRVVVGTDVEYAIYVEEGTSKMPAQPYMGPAVQELEPELPKIMGAEIKAIISYRWKPR